MAQYSGSPRMGLKNSVLPERSLHASISGRFAGPAPSFKQWQRCRAGRYASTTCQQQVEEQDTMPSTSKGSNVAYLRLRTLPTSAPSRAGLAMAVVASTYASGLVTPAAGLCSETLTGSSVDLFRHFLERIEELGPWGALLFTLTVMTFEMVPLFPTQPLSMASGLLFGPVKGATLMLIGVTLASLNAFLISRGIGRSLAQRIIKAELNSEKEEANAISQQLAKVEAAIESGGFWRQFMAVVLLRLTPVVPFSASNYLLGLTPMLLPAYLLGTAVGMTAWSFLYASLGGASRVLLDNGEDVTVLISELAEKSSQYTATAGTVMLAAGGAAAAYAVASSFYKPVMPEPLPPAQPPTQDADTAEQSEETAKDAAKEKVLQCK